MTPPSYGPDDRVPNATVAPHIARREEFKARIVDELRKQGPLKSLTLHAAMRKPGRSPLGWDVFRLATAELLQERRIGVVQRGSRRVYYALCCAVCGVATPLVEVKGVLLCEVCQTIATDLPDHPEQASKYARTFAKELASGRASLP